MNQSSDSTSFSLLARAQRHEPQAWQRLTTIYGPLVYGWCRRAGVSADDAADVCQEVFRAVSRDIAGFRHNGRSGFRAWLRTITKHRVSDHFTALRRGPRATGGSEPQLVLQEFADPAAPDSDRDNHLDRERALEHVRRELDALPELQRRAVELCDVQGMDRDAAADVLGVERGHLRVLLHRGRHKLRTALEQSGITAVPASAR